MSKKSTMQVFPPVQSMSMQQIWDKSFALWMEFIAEVGVNHAFRHGSDFSEFYDALLYPKYEISLVTNEDLGVDGYGVPIFGKYLPNENAAFVDRKLFESNDPRKLFTEIHEAIGHGVLHGPFLRGHAKKYPKLYTTEDGIGSKGREGGFNWRQMSTFEWQANAFAFNAIAPRNFVLCMYGKVFGTTQRIKFRGPNSYNLVCNRKSRRAYVRSPLQLAWVIAKQIQHYFWGLSAESLAYQVLEVAVDCNGYARGDLSEWGPAVRIGEIISQY